MGQFDPEHWYTDAVRYFRAFGFFANSPLSELELGEAIQSYWHGDWSELLRQAADSASADQFLLVADTQRVWWHDLEGVYQGADRYPAALQEWALISRGQFMPEQAQETWQTDQGSVQVSFEWHGRRHTFVHRSGDFIDHAILKLINQALAHTPVRYEVAIDFADSNWITVLCQKEKERLKKERGWHFLW